MEQPKSSPDNQPSPFGPAKRLQTGAILLLVIATALAGLTLLGSSSNPVVKKDKHQIRPAEYYGLVFHTHKMGDAVYQASGDGKNCPLQGCRPDPQPLQDWMSESVVLVSKMSKADGISNQCRDAAIETQNKLTVLKVNLRKDTPYKSGYQAWKDINALLLTCD